MRLRVTVAIVALAAVASGLGIGFNRLGHSARASGGQTQYVLPSLSPYGMRLVSEQPGPSVISSSSAVAAAVAVSPLATNGALPGGVSVSTDFGDFSDDHYGVTPPGGTFQLYFQSVPAWIVTFYGSAVNLPPFGAPRTAAGSATVTSGHSAQHIVINAKTGSFMIEFD